NVGKDHFWHSNLHQLLKEKGHVQSVSVTETI
ncbi:MgtC/SapB family protein, partial [Enterococcus faecalis]